MSEAGYHRGRHFTEWVEEVKTLRRSGRNEDALLLLTHLMDATEAEAAHQGKQWGVAPSYYEQAAIIYRKNGDLDAEVAVLERFAAQPHAPGSKPPQLSQRLSRAKALRSR
ncbi:hypothetical protein KLP28_06965 [Nocardioidaceae bacterium]|nr:hypothetical protein KLP28_06965 [Nocardioidaceae bacterium]